MAIRLRRISGTLVALCAAETPAEPGDKYLDDEEHEALAHKFGGDWRTCGINAPYDYDPLVQLLVMEKGRRKEDG